MFSAQAATRLDVTKPERPFVHVLPLAAVADTDTATRVQRLDEDEPAVALAGQIARFGSQWLECALALQNSLHRVFRDSKLLGNGGARQLAFSQGQNLVVELLRRSRLEALLQPHRLQVVDHGLVGASGQCGDGVDTKPLLTEADDSRTGFRPVPNSQVFSHVLPQATA
jgi:hypothetical protein